MKTKPKPRAVWIACSEKCVSGHAFSDEEGCDHHVQSLGFKDWKAIRFVEAPKRRKRK